MANVTKVYIGYTDLKHEGDYIWDSTAESGPYKNWDHDQPEGTGHDCTELRVNKEGRWYSNDCTRKLYAACKKGKRLVEITAAECEC